MHAKSTETGTERKLTLVREENMARIYKGYQFRLYPTKEQEEQLRKIFSAVHFTYNRLLIRWAGQSGMDFHTALDELIHENPWLAFINRSILMHTAANLQKACRDNIREYGPLPPNADQLLMNTRSRRTSDPGGTHRTGTAPGESVPNANGVTETASVRDDKSTILKENPAVDKSTGKTVRKMPRFKTMKDRKEAFTIAAANDIFIRYNKLTLGGQRGLKPIRVVQSRALPQRARICSATVSRDRSGEYLVSILCSENMDVDPDAWKRNIGIANGLAVVGLDYSLPSFFVASDPYLRPDEEFLHNAQRNQDRLAAAQRRLSGMKKGSANYEKQRVKVARIHRKTVNQRKDYLHKLSTQIADRYDIVCVETLDLIEMGHYCRGFARRIQDNGWSEFIDMLEYKMRDRGKKLVRVGRRFPSSKRCHECSYINRDLQLSDREWTCPVCGTRHNRDINASLNIRDEGMRILLQQEQKKPGSELSGRGRNHIEPGGYSPGSAREPDAAPTRYKTASSLAAEDIRIYPSDDNYYASRFGDRSELYNPTDL